ncbi:hypothetical protein [Thermomonospora catenispora]|uniref:hypothetical protein n=1 Tax=Thermomonospora catenispora TaxID=2493090 RepID=UPI001120275D|nr:hypothetical protein [Thermomonospora catenispora]TNY35821.1 hypothetical protein EIO00_16125 [Thermomonospora catenispora]
MKTATRHAGLLRYLGYGGSLLLVVAALVVLALPLLNSGDGARTAADERTSGGARPTAPQDGGPAAPVDDPVRPTAGRGGTAATGGDPIDRQQIGGSGDPLAQAGGQVRRYCPRGMGAVRYTMTDLQVTVQTSGASFVQVEVHLQGLTSRKQTAQLKGGQPYTFTFRQVLADQVERIQVRSVGATVPQTCDLPLA